MRELQQREENSAAWRVETQFSLFASSLGRGFPVVLSVMNGGGPAPSSQDPAAVALRLAAVFES
jgi:hypothetical protein